MFLAIEWQLIGSVFMLTQVYALLGIRQVV